MREGLRLGPTAPGRTVGAAEDTVIGGKYAVEKGTPVFISTYTMHRDPKVWGEDVRGFSATVMRSRAVADLRDAGRPIPPGAHARWEVRGSAGESALSLRFPVH